MSGEAKQKKTNSLSAKDHSKTKRTKKPPIDRLTRTDVKRDSHSKQKERNMAAVMLFTRRVPLINRQFVRTRVSGATSVWKGTLKEGSGSTSVASGKISELVYFHCFLRPRCDVPNCEVPAVRSKVPAHDRLNRRGRILPGLSMLRIYLLSGLLLRIPV